MQIAFCSTVLNSFDKWWYTSMHSIYYATKQVQFFALFIILRILNYINIKILTVWSVRNS